MCNDNTREDHSSLVCDFSFLLYWGFFFSTIMLELIGSLLYEMKKEEEESEGSLCYATQITIKLDTLIASERYPLKEC